MPDLLRTLLAPVLLVQGKRMFARMPRLAPPAPLADGPCGDGPGLSLLLVGDSSAAGYGADRQENALLGQLVERLAARHRVAWQHHARFGSTIPKTTAWLAKQPAHPVDLAVVAVGLNDVIAGAGLAEWTAGYDRLVGLLQTRFEAGHVVVSGLPPVGEFPALPQPMRFVIGRQRDRHDAALRALADRTPGVTYVATDASAAGPLSQGVAVSEVMAADGFHPGPRVYAEWARRVVEAWAAD
ncbi:SGNH/GDSL hydrolase family protein [Rubrivirga sp. IMCC43871]|uniref:SGNH/GDSL hydrolase family protein n=1 Tax=Rubrivirga sp. IMCC43871 TaxID=3391575 RepID=UPI00398FBCAC